MVEGFLSLVGNLLNLNSTTQEERQYYYTQTLLLGEQHQQWSEYVSTTNLINIIRTFLMPLLLTAILLYLIYKKNK